MSEAIDGGEKPSLAALCIWLANSGRALLGAGGARFVCSTEEGEEEELEQQQQQQRRGTREGG